MRLRTRQQQPEPSSIPLVHVPSLVEAATAEPSAKRRKATKPASKDAKTAAVARKTNRGGARAGSGRKAYSDATRKDDPVYVSMTSSEKALQIEKAAVLAKKLKRRVTLSYYIRSRLDLPLD